MTKVAIVGANGYSGEELCAILARHPARQDRVRHLPPARGQACGGRACQAGWIARDRLDWSLVRPVSKTFSEAARSSCLSGPSARIGRGIRRAAHRGGKEGGGFERRLPTA